MFQALLQLDWTLSICRSSSTISFRRGKRERLAYAPFAKSSTPNALVNIEYFCMQRLPFLTFILLWCFFSLTNLYCTFLLRFLSIIFYHSYLHNIFYTVPVLPIPLPSSLS